MDTLQNRSGVTDIETRAGHGAGKPTSNLIEEITDQWAFLVKELGVVSGRW